MTSKNQHITKSAIAQALDNLRDIEDTLLCDRISTTSDLSIERVCRVVTAALTAIDDRLTGLEMSEANRVYVARLEAELRPASQFTDLGSLVKAACSCCGSAYEVIAPAGSGRYFTRCVSPKCERHGVLSPISRRLAMAWDDLAQSEDAAFTAMEEAGGSYEEYRHIADRWEEYLDRKARQEANDAE